VIQNYLLVALRSLKRNATYTVVNVVGLSIGMACCALIMILVYHEWSYDRFHENGPDLYRTYFQWQELDGTMGYQAMMTPGFTEEFRSEFPQVQRATPYVTGNQNLEAEGEISRHLVAEIHNDLFSMFSFPLLAGDASQVLLGTDEMVISAQLAESKLGIKDGNWNEALGRTISITREQVQYDFNVVGVFQDIPSNSSVQMDAALSFTNYGRLQLGGNNWGGRVTTYVQLIPDSTPEAILTAAGPFTDRSFGKYIDALRDAERLATDSEPYGFELQSLSDMHTSTEVFMPYEKPAHDPVYSYILGGIGLLILLIACINFMTLSVGQSAGRAREVGVRKVLGAHKFQLMKQYFGESTVLATLSLGLEVVGPLEAHYQPVVEGAGAENGINHIGRLVG